MDVHERLDRTVLLLIHLAAICHGDEASSPYSFHV